LQGYASNLLAQAQNCKAEAEELKSYQRLFQFQVTKLDELEDTLIEVALKELLWRSWSSMQEWCLNWRTDPFFQVRGLIQPDEMMPRRNSGHCLCTALQSPAVCFALAP
jgi:hypothetical protein